MSVRKLDEAELRSWVNGLIRERSVFGVMAKGARFVFGPLTSAKELRLDHDVTILPPKKYLLPQTEALVCFGGDSSCEAVFDAKPQILLGVHPYDVVAIAQMDAVFAREPADPHYLKRRAATMIVACDIQEPSPHIFASCMGAATVQEGFDVLITKIGAGYLVDARTEGGEELLDSVSAPEADPVSLGRREQVWVDNARLLRSHRLACKPEELPAVLEAAYDNPIWEERAQHCYSCGSCNLVCPTCYCFDLRDDVDWDLGSGERRRTWDGCMLKQFATVAGNHNFRDNRASRYRHRYYRKGKYQWDRMGQIACVGCGRCVSACTTNIASPIEIYNALQEVT